MSKEAPRNHIDSFNFSQDGSSPFEMIASGAFTFEAPTPELSRSALLESSPMAVSVKSPLAKVISFEERLAGRRNPAIKVDVSRRDWLVQEIKINQTSIVRLAEMAMAAARRDAENCATDGHANKITSTLSSLGKSFVSSNIKNTSPNGVHKEGKHDHCNGCGGDLTDGKCSKCAA